MFDKFNKIEYYKYLRDKIRGDKYHQRFQDVNWQLTGLNIQNPHPEEEIPYDIEYYIGEYENYLHLLYNLLSDNTSEYKMKLRNEFIIFYRDKKIDMICR